MFIYGIAYRVLPRSLMGVLKLGQNLNLALIVPSLQIPLNTNNFNENCMIGFYDIFARNNLRMRFFKILLKFLIYIYIKYQN